MRYHALVKAVDPIVEEEVTLEINGVEVVAFVTICPYQIEVGQRYPVMVGFTILDDLEIHEMNGECKELERIESSYQYIVRGLLIEESIDAGIIISDEDDYFSDYRYLNGQYVELKVDRISVEFLTPEVGTVL